MTDEVIWAGRPSARPLLPAAIVMIALAWGAYVVSGPVSQAFIDATADMIAWTHSNVLIPYYAIQVAGVLPLAVVLWRVLVLKTTMFAMTGSRLLWNRGVLFRSYDQVRLERVRDFRVLKPLAARLTGTGYVLVVSRDETWPEMILGPFAKPLEIEATIRQQVVTRQEEVDYRELETT